VDEPGNVDLWAKMQLGAYYAGIALMNSGAGPAGAMSYPLGVYFGVPHGLAGGVFLGPVGRLNMKRGCTLYADLYDLIDDGEIGMSVQEKNGAFFDRLSLLCEKLGVPPSLGVFGVSRNDVAMLAEVTMQLKGAVEQNPIPMDLRDIKTVLEGLTGNS
jgi:alcohol dehydrogenase class IV